MGELNYEARPHQMRALTSKKKFIFLGAGVGAGKTDIGALWVIQKVQRTPPGVIGVICANSYSQLFDSTARNLFKNFKKWGIKFKPQEFPRRPAPFNMYVHNGRHWVEILFRSLDNYEFLSGIETGWWWADEVWQTKEEAIDLLTARLRDKDMEKADSLQGLMTTTLDDPSTWMYRMFVENFEANIMDVIYATTYDNQKNLPDGYIEGLKSMYDARLFLRMVMAKWVALSGSVVYAAFNRDDHMDETVFYDDQLPVLWTHDFNIGEKKPASSAICQIKKGTQADGTHGLELHIFDEIIVETSDTNDVIKEFLNRYPDIVDVIIYGDAAGRAKDTRSKKTDYILMEESGFRNQKVPKSNPPIRDRHNAVNGLLKNMKGHVRMKIHPRCKTLLKGLETVKLKKGTGYLEEETYEQHVTTALGYLVYQEFPINKKKFTRHQLRG